MDLSKISNVEIVFDDILYVFTNNDEIKLLFCHNCLCTVWNQIRSTPNDEFWYSQQSTATERLCYSQQSIANERLRYFWRSIANERLRYVWRSRANEWFWYLRWAWFRQCSRHPPSLVYSRTKRSHSKWQRWWTWRFPFRHQKPDPCVFRISLRLLNSLYIWKMLTELTYIRRDRQAVFKKSRSLYG